MTLEQQFLSTEGRINRKIFILYLIAFNLLMLVLAAPMFFINFGNDDFAVEIISTTISAIVELAMLPGFFLSVKRLHDLNKSAVFIVLYLVPLVNIIFLLYLICFKGTKGENRYGSNPLNPDYENTFVSAVSTDKIKIGSIERKYFSTLGRLNRKPFIRYLLVLLICTALLAAGCLAFIRLLEAAHAVELFLFFSVISVLYLYLIVTLPLRFLLIRRLHDLNLSGWWIALGTILPLGYMAMAVCLMFSKGTQGENRYGADPLDTL